MDLGGGRLVQRADRHLVNVDMGGARDGPDDGVGESSAVSGVMPS